MLEELHIRGLGVIADAVLPLHPGLTVVTGETGAGKTMVVTGLLLLFGGRADAARVRAGADQASVDGRLQIAASGSAAMRVAAAGGTLDEDGADEDGADQHGAGGNGEDGAGLVLRRTVSASGRSRAHVGGAASPVAVLAELAESLVVVHGQSDQLRLTRPGRQREALDSYAGIDRSDYEQAYAAWRHAGEQLAERSERAGELRREADLLAHGLADIEAADPQPGEDADLTALAGRLAHADALRLAARAAHDALLGDADDPIGDADDVSSLLAVARRELGQSDGADPELDALAARLQELSALAADLGAEFGAYEAALDTDPARLAQVEDRRAVLAALVRKYGDGADPDLGSVLRWAQRASARLVDVDVSDEAIDALRARRDAAAEAAARAAAVVSDARRKGAVALGDAVTAELSGLAMPTARLAVDVRPRPASSGPTLRVDGIDTGAAPDGVDEVEFLLRPHADAPALPLARGASGGELSRVMLALEVSLAGTDPVPTMVFDEVDAGVGGRAAVEVGRRLARLSRAHQVVVVTHLAQVAAYADRHVVVDKPVSATAGGEGVTASDVHVVTGDERVAELARMLAGSQSGTALDHAAELLADAATERGGATKPPRRNRTKSRA